MSKKPIHLKFFFSMITFPMTFKHDIIAVQFPLDLFLCFAFAGSQPWIVFCLTFTCFASTKKVTASSKPNDSDERKAPLSKCRAEGKKKESGKSKCNVRMAIEAINESAARLPTFSYVMGQEGVLWRLSSLQTKG